MYVIDKWVVTWDDEDEIMKHKNLWLCVVGLINVEYSMLEGEVNRYFGFGCVNRWDWNWDWDVAG